MKLDNRTRPFSGFTQILFMLPKTQLIIIYNSKKFFMEFSCKIAPYEKRSIAIFQEVLDIA